MVNNVVRSLFISGLGLASLAQAEEAKVEKKVTPYGYIVSRMHLMDSERQNTPDFQMELLRFGLKVSEGAAKGNFMVEAKGATAEGDAKAGRIVLGVRQADLGMDFGTGTTFRLGRVRPGNVDAWGGLDTYATNGYAWSEGLKITQHLDIQEGTSLDFGLTYGNSLIALGNKGSIGVTTWTATSANTGRAVVLSAGVTASNVAAKFMYGMHPSLESTSESKDASGNVTKTALLNDVSYMEASLGYNLDNIGAGVWMYQTGANKTKTYAGYEGGKAKDEKVVDTIKKTTMTHFGLGMNGDSTLFGVKDTFQAGDKWIYGASFEMDQTRTDGATGDAKTAEEDADTKQITLQGGYSINGGLTLSLNITNSSSKGKNFASNKGVAGEKTSAMKANVAAEWYF